MDGGIRSYEYGREYCDVGESYSDIDHSTLKYILLCLCVLVCVGVCTMSIKLVVRHVYTYVQRAADEVYTLLLYSHQV